MRRVLPLAIITLFAGCSTRPIADVLDTFRIGAPRPAAGPIRGGVCEPTVIPQQPVYGPGVNSPYIPPTQPGFGQPQPQPGSTFGPPPSDGSTFGEPPSNPPTQPDFGPPQPPSGGFNPPPPSPPSFQ